MKTSNKCKPKETSIQKQAQSTGNPSPSYITISADELERIKSVNSDELEKQVTERVKAALTGEQRHRPGDAGVAGFDAAGVVA